MITKEGQDSRTKREKKLKLASLELSVWKTVRRVQGVINTGKSGGKSQLDRGNVGLGSNLGERYEPRKDLVNNLESIKK